MRWRIGLLQDAAALEKQAKKDAASHAAQKQKANAPTVKTEAETKAEEETAKTTDDTADKKLPKPKIRPLSEAKAIETGANFISETFLFSVAAALILFESWRSRRKASSRREDVKERLDDLEESDKAARRALIELEHEVLRLRAKESKSSVSSQKRILPKELYEIPKEAEDNDEVSRSWFARIASYIRSKEDVDEEAEQALATDSPGPAEKILVETDKALEEKHRRQAAEDAAREAGSSTKKVGT
jgi:hypothetical protein